MKIFRHVSVTKKELQEWVDGLTKEEITQYGQGSDVDLFLNYCASIGWSVVAFTCAEGPKMGESMLNFVFSGEGVYSLPFSSYDPAPNRQKIIKNRGGNMESTAETETKPKFSGLCAGRIVHFVMRPEVVRPAIITRVISKTEGQVGLRVFADECDPPGIPYDEQFGVPGVANYDGSEAPAPCTWHWIPRED